MGERNGVAQCSKKNALWLGVDMGSLGFTSQCWNDNTKFFDNHVVYIRRVTFYSAVHATVCCVCVLCVCVLCVCVCVCVCVVCVRVVCCVCCVCACTSVCCVCVCTCVCVYVCVCIHVCVCITCTYTSHMSLSVFSVTYIRMYSTYFCVCVRGHCLWLRVECTFSRNTSTPCMQYVWEQ